MKFVRIAEGVSVNVEEIQAVTANFDNLTSTVTVGGVNYQSTLPYDLLLDAIEKRIKGGPQARQLRILETLGSYAG